MRKYFIIFITILFTLSGCDENETVDTTIMPEITNEGKQTFACLIDGWLYVGGRYLNWGIFVRPHFEFRYYTDEVEGDHINVSIKVSDYEYITFTILEPREGETTQYTNFKFDDTQFPDGQVYISYLNKGRNIISGTFEDGDRVSHGRFDMIYDLK